MQSCKDTDLLCKSQRNRGRMPIISYFCGTLFFIHFEMGVIDIIIVCCFLPAIFVGISKGLVRQLVAICVIYFGITLSLKFTDLVSTFISERISLEGFWVNLISFIIIFAIVAVAFTILGKIITKIIKVSLLGWVDKLLGVILALFISAIIVSTLIYFIDSINTLLQAVPAEKLEESKFFTPLLNFAKSIFPHLGKLF